MQRWSLVAASVALTATLAACTSATPSPGSSPTESVPPSVTAPPAPSTPVPAPVSGDVHGRVPAGTLPPPIEVALDERAEIKEGVTVEITRVETISVQAQGPGEVSGPGISVALHVVNQSREPLDLSMITVNLTDSEGRPGSGMAGEPAAWFRDSVAPGGDARAVYVFTVPEGSRSPVRVEFMVHPSIPQVFFTGDVG